MLQLKKLKLKHDYRLQALIERLNAIGNVIAVASSKGGVGKTITACMLSLILAKQKYKTGLLDLDFTGPACHIVFGVRPEEVMLEEEEGVKPVRITSNLYFMSITFFTKDRMIPLRGAEQVSVLRELVVITNWGSLDFLIIDTPPTLSDIIIELSKYGKRINFLIVTTRSRLALNSTRKIIEYLKASKANILGLIENMSLIEDEMVKDFCKRLAVEFLGKIPFDNELEGCYGNINKLLKTKFAFHLERIVTEVLRSIMSL